MNQGREKRKSKRWSQDNDLQPAFEKEETGRKDYKRSSGIGSCGRPENKKKKQPRDNSRNVMQQNSARLDRRSTRGKGGFNLAWRGRRGTWSRTPCGRGCARSFRGDFSCNYGAASGRLATGSRWLALGTGGEEAALDLLGSVGECLLPLSLVRVGTKDWAWAPFVSVSLGPICVV